MRSLNDLIISAFQGFLILISYLPDFKNNNDLNYSKPGRVEAEDSRVLRQMGQN